jgi:hypothetical protein
LFHPTVVFEEGDIVGGAFHPCHETEFIVKWVSTSRKCPLCVVVKRFSSSHEVSVWGG